jgi:hypothetical protein
MTNVERVWQHFFSTNIVVLKQCYVRDFYDWIDQNRDLYERLLDKLLPDIDKEISQLMTINPIVKEIYGPSNNEKTLKNVKSHLTNHLRNDPKKIKSIVDALYSRAKSTGVLDPTGITVFEAKRGFLLPQALLVGNDKVPTSEYTATELIAVNFTQNLISNFYRRVIIEPLRSGRLQESLKAQYLDRAKKGKLDVEKHRTVMIGSTKVDIFEADKMKTPTSSFSVIFWILIGLLVLVVAYVVFMYRQFNIKQKTMEIDDDPWQ